MPAAIEPVIKQRVIAQYLQGDSRDRIAANNIGNILDECKRASTRFGLRICKLTVHLKRKA